MSDISDLHGVFPVPLRWNAEHGTLSYSIYDEAAGERELKEIQLGSPTAKFVADLATRERGYGKVKVGLYDMRLTAVASPPPPWPDDDEFKPALGMWLWNPLLGELRLETNAALFLRTVSALWERCRTFQECAQGLQPVIHFVDRRERPIAALGKVFFEPVINIVGWFDRNATPTLRLREPTVPPPQALPALPGSGNLQNPASERPKPAKSRRKAAPPSAVPRSDLDSELDDELPW